MATWLWACPSNTKAPETVKVSEPPTVKESKIEEPDQKLTILISDNCNAYLALTPGEFDNKTDETQSVEDIRRSALTIAIAEYNRISGKNIELTAHDIESFIKMPLIGVPIERLHQFCSLDKETQDEWLADKNLGAGNLSGVSIADVGIPVTPLSDSEPDKDPSELQIWLKAFYASSEGLAANIDAGKALTLKVNPDLPFDRVEPILESLKEIGMNKFSLMTSLKSLD